jgi:hypothetical protein
MNEFNDKGNAHGYWETYWNNDKSHWEGNFNNGIECGYWTWYKPDGEIFQKEFYL